MNRPLPERTCYLCSNGINALDYRDPQLLQRFVSPYAKILPRRRTGTCARHQRTVMEAVKRARIMAIVAVTKH